MAKVAAKATGTNTNVATLTQPGISPRFAATTSNTVNASHKPIATNIANECDKPLPAASLSLRVDTVARSTTHNRADTSVSTDRDNLALPAVPVRLVLEAMATAQQLLNSGKAGQLQELVDA